MFEECLLDYLGNTIVFISWTACGILKCKMKYFTSSWSGFQMFNKQGMIFGSGLGYINQWVISLHL